MNKWIAVESHLQFNKYVMEYGGDRFLIYSWKLEEHQLNLLAIFLYHISVHWK